MRALYEDQRFAKLKQDIEEQKKFYKEGLERIRKYYFLPENEREEKTGLKDSPHEILKQRASNLILLGLQTLEKKQYVEDEPIGYVLTTIGTEILLKAIILKEDPNYFIENIRDEKTLSFQQCCKKLIKLLAKTLTQKQKRRINEVLALIQQKRNNLVHLGFHQMGNYREDYQIANVLGFLLSYFFKEDTEGIAEKLNEFKKRKVTSGIDYEPVEFLREIMNR